MANNTFDRTQQLASGGNMFEYTGGVSSPLYDPSTERQPTPNPNQITLLQLQQQQQQNEVSNNPNPSTGVKISPTTTTTAPELSIDDSFRKINPRDLPPTQDRLLNRIGDSKLGLKITSGFDKLQADNLFNPNRPAAMNSNQSSPRKQKQQYQQQATTTCYAISCADGLPDDPQLKLYITNVITAVKTSDPTAEVMDLERIEMGLPLATTFEQREASLVQMRSQCNGLICCIPKNCSLERWLRAMVEAREMYLNQFPVLALVDPHETIPPIFASCCEKMFTAVHELERYVSGKSRRRAIDARNKAAGR
jgi:hypothetical protein